MKNEKVKIGGVEFGEFELPFRYDKKHDVVVDSSVDEIGIAVPTGSVKRKHAMGEIIADALNLKFGYRSAGE